MEKNYKVVLKSKILPLVIIVLFSVFSSCKNTIEVGPPKTEIVSESVFSSDASAISAVRGIYSLMISNTSFTNSGIEEYSGIASDELINYATRQDQAQFYLNTLSNKNGDVLQVFWKEAYRKRLPHGLIMIYQDKRLQKYWRRFSKRRVILPTCQ